MKISKLLANLALILSTATLPAYAKPFNVVGEWSGSPDCPIVFYRDDGVSIEGNCDNGSFDHVIKGTYANENLINITLTRIDPNGCRTSVKGYLQVLNPYTMRMSQQGWNGCGVRTGPGGQTWQRKGMWDDTFK